MAVIRQRPEDDGVVAAVGGGDIVAPGMQQQALEERDGMMLVRNSPYGDKRAKLGWGDLFTKPARWWDARFPNVFIGMSSLNGVPAKQREMPELLKLYARKGICLEHCATYHGMNAPDVWAKWRAYAAAAHPGFMYTVKANQFLTHTKQLKVDDETRQHIVNFFADRVSELRERAGAVLLQLPPGFRCTPEHLGRVRDVGALITQAAPTVDIAIEFRDASWFCDEVYDVLVQLKWALVATHNHDTGDSPVVDRVNLAAGRKGMMYCRLHGALKQFMGDYGRARMKLWAAKIRNFLAQAGPEARVFCFLNNNESHINSLTSSVVDATALAEELFAGGPIVHAAAAAAPPADAREDAIELN